MARALRGRLGLGAVLGGGLIVALAGCSPPPPPPPPTVVQLTMTASQDVNPSASGQGTPVQVVVYQLASATSFNGAEFFQLFNQDQTTLGADLIKRDQYTLAPGKSQNATLSPTDPVKMLGVFAAYQNFQGVTWRGSVPIPAHQTTNVTVTAGKAGITVTAAPAPAPPSKPGS
jgi:type VI secretion system protein VasD